MRPILQEEFLPQYETVEKDRLQFGKSIRISRSVHPFKKRYLPFYEQMATQLTALLKQYTRRSFEKRFDFSFRTRAYERMGKPYMEKIIMQGVNSEMVILRKSTQYRGEFLKLHKDGYAYGNITMYNRIGLSDSAEIWLRWKSNIPGYEYIEPDDELDLKPEDITFEICSQVPEEYTLRLFAKTAEEYDCNQWIDFLNDEHHYPQKREKKCEFLCEVAENCQYPDTTVTLFFNDKVTQELADKTIKTFISFQEEWDTTHFWGIHSIGFADEERQGENDIKILVDFGSSDYQIIKALVKWLRYSGLDINKVVIE